MVRTGAGRLPAALGLAALSVCLPEARAGDYFWGSSSGSWNNSGNWIQNALPGSGDVAVLDFNPNPTTHGVARVITSVGTVGRVGVRRGNTLSVERRGVLTTLGDVNLGLVEDGYLTVSSDLPTILNPATINVGCDLRLGVQDGNGRVDQSADFVNVTGNVALGFSNITNNPGQPSGRYNLTGGRLNVSGTLYAGFDASGSYGDVYVHSPAYAQVHGIAGNSTGFINQLGGEVHVGQGGIVFPSSPRLLDYTLRDGTLASARTVVNSGGVIHFHGGFLSAGRLDVNGGRVIVVGAGEKTINALEVTVNPSPGGLPGFIDLKEGRLVVNSNGPADSEAIRALIRRGYRDGQWTSGGGAFAYDGITSSAAGASAASSSNHKTALGYADTLDLFADGPAGPAEGGSSIIVRYTLYGDANLDKQVNLADFNKLASNFGGTNKFWSQGDFTYDGVVNLADFNKLAANFGIVASGPDVTPQEWAALAAAVPEPTALALLAVSTFAGLSRRRRR